MNTSASTHAARSRRPGRLMVAAGLLAASLLGLFASPSTAGPPEIGPRRPLARMQLILTPVGEAASGAPVITVELSCTPDGGTHPTPAEACESLRQVNGDFFRLPDVSGFCPAIFDPHEARARGFWQSSPSSPAVFVSYRETFVNRCAAAAGTDNVFRF
jgi:Subtilisin inhibitor-like